jgi:hypothetical protein
MTPREVNAAFEAERARLGRPMTFEEIQALDVKLTGTSPPTCSLSEPGDAILCDLGQGSPRLTLLESWETFARLVLPADVCPAELRRKALHAYRLGVLETMERLERGPSPDAVLALHIELQEIARSLGMCRPPPPSIHIAPGTPILGIVGVVGPEWPAETLRKMADGKHYFFDEKKQQLIYRGPMPAQAAEPGARRPL